MFLANKFVDQLVSNYHMDANIVPYGNNRFAIMIKEKADKVYEMLSNLKYNKFLHMTTNHAGCDRPVYEENFVLKHVNGYLVIMEDDDLATKMNIVDHNLREYYSNHSMIK